MSSVSGLTEMANMQTRITFSFSLWPFCRYIRKKVNINIHRITLRILMLHLKVTWGVGTGMENVIGFVFGGIMQAILGSNTIVMMIRYYNHVIKPRSICQRYRSSWLNYHISNYHTCFSVIESIPFFLIVGETSSLLPCLGCPLRLWSSSTKDNVDDIVWDCVIKFLFLLS